MDAGDEGARYIGPYLDEYYRSLTDENREIGEFLTASTRGLRLGPRAGYPRRALDVGCGPTMLYWGLFLDGFDEHHGMDRLPSNVSVVREEARRGRGGIVHPRYRDVCAYRDRTSTILADRFRRLCERARVIEADATAPWPFEDASMTAVTALFSLEVLPDRDALRFALREGRRVLVPGGRMIVVSLCETSSWRIGQDEQRCLFIKAGALERDLCGAGFEGVRIERRVASTAIDQEQGYSWMLMATADVGARDG